MSVFHATARHGISVQNRVAIRQPQHRTTGEPLNRNRFYLRRGRAGFTLEERWVFGHTHVELQGTQRLWLAPYEGASRDAAPHPLRFLDTADPAREMQ